MPKVNSICVLMADGAGNNGPVKILDLLLNVETCGHMLISGSNGEGKTSNIIEPWLWLFDKNAGVKDRHIKDIYNPEKGRVMSMPYVFFLDWTLDAPAGEKLAVGYEHLLTGFVLDSRLSEGGELRARYFHFTHGDAEFRSDWMETIRRHGLRAYEKSSDGCIVPHKFDEIVQSLKTHGARVFTAREQRAFRESLEREYGFFKIAPYIELMKVCADHEDAVGTLREDKDYKADTGLMDNLIIPMISAGIYGDEEAGVLARYLAECAVVEFKNKDTIARLETLNKIIATSENLMQPAGRHAQSARDVIEALDALYSAEYDLGDVKDALRISRGEYEVEQVDLGTQMTNLRVERLSYDVHRESDRLLEAEVARDEAREAQTSAESKVEALQEVILRRNLVLANDAYEGAKGTMEGVRASLEELSESEDCKRVDDLSASIWQAYETRIKAKRSERDAKMSECDSAGKMADEARREKSELNDSQSAIREKIGGTRGQKISLESDIKDLLRGVGHEDLFPENSTPDITAIDVKRTEYSRSAQSNDEQRESELKREAALRQSVDEMDKAMNDGRVRIAGLQADLKEATARAEELSRLLADIESKLGRSPKDASDANAVALSLVSKGVELNRERNSAESDLSDVRAKLARANKSVGHVPTPIRKWLDDNGVPYITGEKHIENLREQGVDVEDILSKCHVFPSVVIVPARVRDEVLEAAKAVENIEGQGLSYVLTEDEVSGEFWDDPSFSKMLGLIDRDLVVDRKGYISSLEQQLAAVEKRLSEVREAISQNDMAKASVTKLIDFIDRVEGRGFHQIESAPHSLAQAIEDVEGEIEKLGAEREASVLKADEAASNASRLLKESESARAAAKDLAAASEYGHRFIEVRNTLSEQLRVAEDLAGKISKLESEISTLEGEANDARMNARLIEREIDDLKTSQSNFTVFDAEAHTLIDGEVESLKAQHETLRSSLGKSSDELTERLTKCSAEVERLKEKYEEVLKLYSPHGGIEDAKRREVVTEATWLHAKMEIEDAKEIATEARAQLISARKELDEASKSKSKAEAAFKKAYPDKAVVPRDEIVDTDFDVAERRLTERSNQIHALVSSLVNQISEIEKAADALKVARNDAFMLLDSLRKHKRPEHEGGKAAFSDKDAVIHAAGVSRARLREAVEAFRASGQNRSFATDLHSLCALADDGDAIKGADLHLMEPEKCFDLVTWLEQVESGCKFERISVERVGRLAEEKLATAKLFFIESVDKLVSKGRALEKLSDGTVRIYGLSNRFHHDTPASDPEFDAYAEEWLSRRVRGLVDDMEKAASDPVNFGDPMNYAMGRAKGELSKASTLLKAWAGCISKSQPGDGNGELRPQMKVQRGNSMTGWLDWHGITNSKGEISASINRLIVALASSIKPETGKGGKSRDALGITIIMDGPFRGMSDLSKISAIFKLYGNRNVQLIATADEVSKSVDLSIPTEYRLFTLGTHENIPVIGAECISKERDMAAISYVDQNLGQRQLELDLQ